MLVIGVDTGGTFTDFIWRDGESWGEFKCLSTPENPAQAVLAGVDRITGGRDFGLVHGSTVATNAILEKKGARTALVTTRRFEDIIEIGRQNRSVLYDFSARKNPPLVPRQLRFGLPGRVDCHGLISEELHKGDIEALLEPLRAAGVESIAVSYLFSFNDPQHEQLTAQVLSVLDVPISLSHEVLAEFREFERTSTTVINAYVAPKMQRYLTRLHEQIEGRLFRIMQSNGGSISAVTAMRESVRTILSGPAGGVVGAFALGRMAGFDKLITFDMGGTSTDVALLDGALPLTTEASIAGYPVKVPMIAIHTVGAGGGSIATVDTGGSLKVGPESAGADPGPICYGKGDRITVTDAHLYLGRLDPEAFLGGDMALDASILPARFEELAQQLALTPHQLAEGIIAVADTTMERAIKTISVEKGFDPREFTLVSFGGAGGLHAASLARNLSIPEILIPRNPGILSAAGMLMSDVIKDYSQTVMLDGAEAAGKLLVPHFASLEEKGRSELAAEGFAAQAICLERYLDMRYRGQSYEIMVPFSNNIREDFHRQHEQLYGYCNRDKEIELVNVRLRAIGKPDKPVFPEQPQAGERPDPAAFLAERNVVFDGHEVLTRIIDRKRLQNGNRIDGPAVLVEYSATTVLPPYASARVDTFGNLILSIGR
jgi:N-methylhydantoinase A